MAFAVVLAVVVALAVDVAVAFAFAVVSAHRRCASFVKQTRYRALREFKHFQIITIF
jgi:hypothetical protein